MRLSLLAARHHAVLADQHHRQAPPFTLLFFHLEKCGGTSVASWLGSLKRQRYINAFIPFQHASRWAAQAPTVLNLIVLARGALALRAALVAHARLPDWRTSRIAVEFHSLNKRYFVSVVAPAPAAPANVTLITATVVREPCRRC